MIWIHNAIIWKLSRNSRVRHDPLQCWDPAQIYKVRTQTGRHAVISLSQHQRCVAILTTTTVAYLSPHHKLTHNVMSQWGLYTANLSHHSSLSLIWSELLLFLIYNSLPPPWFTDYRLQITWLQMGESFHREYISICIFSYFHVFPSIQSKLAKMYNFEANFPEQQE